MQNRKCTSINFNWDDVCILLKSLSSRIKIYLNKKGQFTILKLLKIFIEFSTIFLKFELQIHGLYIEWLVNRQ